MKSRTEFLAHLKPENRGWFAQFFVEQLVARCAGSKFGAERDAQLRLLTKNQRKLSLLHKRMSGRRMRNDRSSLNPVPPSHRSDRVRGGDVVVCGGKANTCCTCSCDDVWLCACGCVHVCACVPFAAIRLARTLP